MKKLLVLLAAIAVFMPCANAQKKVLRMGHFPNITHAQGVIAHAMTRQGKELVRATPRPRRGDPVVHV